MRSEEDMRKNLKHYEWQLEELRKQGYHERLRDTSLINWTMGVIYGIKVFLGEQPCVMGDKIVA